MSISPLLIDASETETPPVPSVHLSEKAASNWSDSRAETPLVPSEYQVSYPRLKSWASALVPL
ncbi:hypothetical protein BN903_140 [Halorubrum sp. AJ67]|nr:hypothetical protein BN903_140 [Halorubrum sp. AJ67]